MTKGAETLVVMAPSTEISRELDGEFVQVPPTILVVLGVITLGSDNVDA